MHGIERGLLCAGNQLVNVQAGAGGGVVFAGAQGGALVAAILVAISVDQYAFHSMRDHDGRMTSKTFAITSFIFYILFHCRGLFHQTEEL